MASTCQAEGCNADATDGYPIFGPKGVRTWLCEECHRRYVLYGSRDDTGGVDRRWNRQPMWRENRHF